VAVNGLSKSARRITQALDLVAQARTSPSSRLLFDQLGIPRSSGYDLVSSLGRRQYLQNRTGSQWVLGDEIHVLALSRYGLGGIAERIAPALEALQEGTQEVALLAVLDAHGHGRRHPPAGWLDGGRAPARLASARSLCPPIAGHGASVVSQGRNVHDE